jgi:tetratricopeptide (TPR) repeat protein
VWSRDIFDFFHRLKRSAADTEATITGIAECFNQAALVEVHLGRMETARLLCDAHLQWHHSEWLLDRLEYRVKLAVQPWINHLRLDAMTGKGRDARIALRTLRRLKPQDSIDIGPFRIPGGMWHELLGDGKFGTFVSSVCLWDSARSLVRDACWSEARRFADENAVSLRFESDPPVLEELALLADLSEGRTVQALSAASTMCDEEPEQASLFKYYCGRALAQQGLRDRAIECVKEAVDLAIDRLQTVAPTPSGVEVLRELAQLSQSLGDQELAFEAGLAVHTAAAGVEDEVTRIRACALLARSGVGEARDHWESRYEAARARTLYACFGGAPPRHSRVEDADEVAHEGGLCAALTTYARSAGPS